MEFVLGIAYKIVSLMVGGLFMFMGYRLYLRGVALPGTARDRGEFSLSRGNKKVSLKHAGPGIFFCLFGMLIVIVALWKGFSYEKTSNDGRLKMGGDPKKDQPIPGEGR